MGKKFFEIKKIGIDWFPKGDLSLSCAQQILIESMEVSIGGPKIYIKHEVNIPANNIQPNYLLTNAYPTLVIIPMIHRIGASEPLATQAIDPENSKIPANKKSLDSLATTTVPFCCCQLSYQ